MTSHTTAPRHRTRGRSRAAFAVAVVAVAAVGLAVWNRSPSAGRYRVSGVLAPPVDLQAELGGASEVQATLNLPAASAPADQLTSARGATLFSGPIVGDHPSGYAVSVEVSDPAVGVELLEFTVVYLVTAVAEQQTRAVDAAVGAAEIVASDAAAALTALEADTGVVDIGDAYDLSALALQNTETALAAAVTPAERAALEDLLARRQLIHEQLAAALPKWRSLSTRLTEAEAALVDATTAREAATLEASTMLETTRVSQIQEQDVSDIGARVVRTSTAVALAAAAATGVLLGLRRRRQIIQETIEAARTVRQPSPRPPAPAPGQFAPPSTGLHVPVVKRPAREEPRPPRFRVLAKATSSQ